MTNDEMRFWDKVRIGDGCWEWTGHKRRGYGRFVLSGKVRNANRVSLSWATGLSLEGLCACHRCDNPACVRPSHLFAGSISENVRDSVDKGRHWTTRHRSLVPRGRRHWNSRLRHEEVVKIRSRIGAGERSEDVGRSFGITGKYARELFRGKTTWRAE